MKVLHELFYALSAYVLGFLAGILVYLCRNISRDTYCDLLSTIFERFTLFWFLYSIVCAFKLFCAYKHVLFTQ